MTEIINIGDKLNLGIIKIISREIREIKNRLQILEDNDDKILRDGLNKFDTDTQAEFDANKMAEQCNDKEDNANN